MNKPLVLLGAGGHASVLLDSLLQQKFTIAGIISPTLDQSRSMFAGITHFSNDEEISHFNRDKVLLVNGIGSLPKQNLRFRIYGQFIEQGYRFQTVVASNAMVSPFARLGQGVQVMQGAIIQAGAVIGDNTIINTGAIIDHDCVIGAHNHIAPGATLSGEVHTGNYVHIGTGASVIHCINIGEHAVVGAGAVVTKHVGDNETVYPARAFKKPITQYKG